MISCKQAALLSSKASFDALSFIERIKLKMHLKMCTCPTCHDFSKDSALIDGAIDQLVNEHQNDKIELSSAQKEKIRKEIC